MALTVQLALYLDLKGFVMKTLALFAALCALSSWAGEEVQATPALTPEARKREFESIQKELESVKPDEQPTREQHMTYLEMAIEKYGTFAKQNEKTAEGFEAASNLAMLLSQVRHPSALKYAEMATTVAPASGVDVKRVAMCWTLVAQAHIGKGDMKAAKASLDNIKPLDATLHEQIMAQFKQLEEQMDSQNAAKDQLQPGKAPFPITTKDLAGETVTFEKFKGKVLLIDFWASWCGPCMKMMPSLVTLYKERKADGLEILGISLDQGDKEAVAAAKKIGATWTMARDQAIADKWGVQSIPALFLLDRKGIIRYVNLHGGELNDAINALLKEKP